MIVRASKATLLFLLPFSRKRKGFPINKTTCDKLWINSFLTCPHRLACQLPIPLSSSSNNNNHDPFFIVHLVLFVCSFFCS
mmetsp:Transcript_4269/g.12271  ORF Transcript_4269/g.12271 Transcript_4269/m.12271 type:complete len:81 (-) Transcript_4269:190-432(-)